MASPLDLNINKLQAELSTAVEVEAARIRVDDMKKKAITTCANYEEFRHKVACAHLKKLDRKDMESLGRNEPHQRSFSANSAAGHGRIESRRIFKDKTKCDELKFSTAAPTVRPKTTADFEREWRRRCPTAQDKWRYLCLVGGAALPGIFRVEMSEDIVGDILVALEAVE